jgi:membrane protein implicated in regulation of membrane protease activity
MISKFFLLTFILACALSQVLLGFAILYVELGTSALLAGVLLLLVVPIQYNVGKRLGLLQKKAMVSS